MKRYGFFFAVLICAVLLSSCKSAEIPAKTDFSAENYLNADDSVGVVFNDTRRTAVSAEPIPTIAAEYSLPTLEDTTSASSGSEEAAPAATQTSAETAEPAATSAETAETTATSAETTETTVTSAETTETTQTSAETSEMTETSAETTETTQTSPETTETTATSAETAETTATSAETSETTATSAETSETTATSAETAETTATSAETAETAETSPEETSPAPGESASAVLPARTYTKNSYVPINYKYVKAVWISYIELSGLLSGKSEAGFSEGFGKMLDNCASLGINTVFVHVRAFGDAFYRSELFPFTKYLGTAVGEGVGYDPLAIMVREAHARGISLHAWINPLRLCSETDMAALSGDWPEAIWYREGKSGTFIKKLDGIWYLDPAYDETIKLVGDGVREIVSRYDVDGIHIDDYFYPTTAADFDAQAFAESGCTSLKAFRTANCDALVKEIYTAAHECGSCIFGAAPQGSVYNNTEQLYADASDWVKGGYIDYLAPQLYYGFQNTACPYESCLSDWKRIAGDSGVKLIAGLSLYKIGKEDVWAGDGREEWLKRTDMIKSQIESANAAGFGGAALYSYNYLFNADHVTEAIKTEKENFAPLLAG